MNQLDLPADPEPALERLREASREAPLLVFKASPICPVSTAAEERFRAWVADGAGGSGARVAFVDVIDRRPLARGLTRLLDVEHASPQVLVFRDGALTAHASHDAIDAAWLASVVG